LSQDCHFYPKEYNKTMKKYLLIIIISIPVVIFGAWYIARSVSLYRAAAAEQALINARNYAIENVLAAHRSREARDGAADPFGDDGLARVLLIGLDKRTGQTEGHCDVIQLITIDQKNQNVTITAVPRGTYSPLPPGKGVTSSDYYVSNACGLGGLEYGIKQVEKILGQKADYLVVVGFSETLGILRNLHLPTTETLQWLRHRQGYAIGEPQRARNHSTFLKQMTIKFVPAEKSSKIDTALQYILYKIVKTDLSFAEAQALVNAMSGMDLANHPERIRLSMRPAYDVQDIPYVEEHLGEYLDKTLGPVTKYLSKDDYSGVKEEEAQAKLLEIIEAKKNNPEFITWAFENNLWLQIEDDEKRLAAQYDFLERYLPLVSEKAERKNIITDYILEMEHRGENARVEKGKSLLLLFL
jgi:anionic cell wall polymer biosynthesis LytR-Cps2A-Psr (LCP) family protein